jgi:hypothetical protein
MVLIHFWLEIWLYGGQKHLFFLPIHQFLLPLQPLRSPLPLGHQCHQLRLSFEYRQMDLVESIHSFPPFP